MQISQHQWQDNIIKAQNFIYATEKKAPENIIVGSSLSCRLVQDSLQDFFNLSFSGQSVFDGLRILKARKNLPKHLFIEMNVILKEEDKNFTGAILNPFLYSLKKYIPVLRDGKQPMAIAGLVLSEIIKETDNPDVQKVTSINQEALFLKTLNVQKKDYLNTPDKKLSETIFRQLKAYTDYFQEKGVTIIFFEMPVHPSLCNLPKALVIREKFYINFPQNKYHYISMPDCSVYHTTDGIHLTQEETLVYTSYFIRQSKKLF
ncbi:MAG: hypothetical protein U0T69_01000 [Chitinophagales bacterium]